MAKRDMKSALKGSLASEARSVKSRFERAETLLGGKSAATHPEEQGTVGQEAAAAKIKVIRDSFTMPQTDYELITSLKKRSLQSGIETNKSEILRAGLLALNQMPDNEFLSKISIVEKVKTGRPKR